MANIIFRHGLTRPENFATVLNSGEYVVPRGVFVSTPPKRKCSYCGSALESKQCKNCGAPNG